MAVFSEDPYTCVVTSTKPSYSLLSLSALASTLHLTCWVPSCFLLIFVHATFLILLSASARAGVVGLYFLANLLRLLLFLHDSRLEANAIRLHVGRKSAVAGLARDDIYFVYVLKLPCFIEMVEAVLAQVVIGA